MFYSLTYLQWFFAILYLVISYLTYYVYLKNNKKTYVKEANTYFLTTILVTFPGVIFLSRSIDVMTISSKVLGLYLSYYFLFIYYLLLLIAFYKEKEK